MDIINASPAPVGTTPPEEKIKPFRLVKYFTFTGLVVKRRVEKWKLLQQIPPKNPFGIIPDRLESKAPARESA